jgi:hypothetical protein
VEPVHDTVTLPAALDTPETAVGFVGTDRGVVVLAEIDVELVPIRFVAETENLYAMSFASPVTSQLVAGAFTVQEIEPGTAAPAEVSAVAV